MYLQLCSGDSGPSSPRASSNLSTYSFMLHYYDSYPFVGHSQRTSETTHFGQTQSIRLCQNSADLLGTRVNDASGSPTIQATSELSPKPYPRNLSLSATAPSTHRTGYKQLRQDYPHLTHGICDKPDLSPFTVHSLADADHRWIASAP